MAKCFAYQEGAQLGFQSLAGKSELCNELANEMAKELKDISKSLSEPAHNFSRKKHCIKTLNATLYNAQRRAVFLGPICANSCQENGFVQYT